MQIQNIYYIYIIPQFKNLGRGEIGNIQTKRYNTFIVSCFFFPSNDDSSTERHKACSLTAVEYTYFITLFCYFSMAFSVSLKTFVRFGNPIGCSLTNARYTLNTYYFYFSSSYRMYLIHGSNKHHVTTFNKIRNKMMSNQIPSHTNYKNMGRFIRLFLVVFHCMPIDFHSHSFYISHNIEMPHHFIKVT